MGKHLKETKHFNLKLLIFQAISLIIVIMAVYAIINWYKENKENKEILESALSNVSVEKIVINTTEEEPVEYTILDVDFNNLLQTNSDTIGWIYLQNSCINYPIVKGSDNDFYLKHTFNKSYNTAGSIFADYRCASDFSSKNTTIYGHNRMDDSMFATLKNVITEDWYFNSNYLTIATPDGNKIYQVFSVYKIKAETYYSTPDFTSDEQYSEFLKTLTSRSVYNFGITTSPSDKIVTLSTCATNGSYRVVLHAKLINTI